MKKSIVVLLCFLMPFTVFFCGCGYGTRLSSLTGLRAEDIETANYSLIMQSSVMSIEKSKYGCLFKSINVGYRECEDIYSLIYSDGLNEIKCFHIAFKDNRRILMYHLPDKKICIDFNDGENEYHYISNGAVYIPWFILINSIG